MRTRQRIALAWPPMLMRLALGVTFLWAGAGKVFHYQLLSGPEAAMLGVTPGVVPTGSDAKPEAKPAADKPATGPGPTAPLPPVEDPGQGKPADKPTEKPADKPNGAGGKATGSKAGKGKASPPAPTVTKATNGLATNDAQTPAGMDSLDPRALLGEQPVAGATAKQPVAEIVTGPSARALYKLAYKIALAGKPGVDQQGKPTRALLPGWMTSGEWPVRLAWAIAITELVGGVMVLFGLMTRLCSLGFFAVMVGALWMVDFGPAIASGHAVLGFLPDHPAFSVPDWQGPLWRFGLACMSLALFFAGPGLVALDSLLFGSGGDGGGGGGGGKPAGDKGK